MGNCTVIPQVRSGLGDSRRISCVLLLLVLAPGWESARPTADAHNIDFRKQQERKALDQRWGSLIEQRSNPDNAKWAALEDDVRSFASKYDLHLEEHATRANPDNKKTAPEFAQCPPRDDVRSYRCNLFPGPKGVCRYVCVPLNTQVRADRK
jgi:hypothetical protein